ncbi:MAG: VWA domain-containing protein [Opitutaceae bacterium]|jgi:Ca-activated chloride channel family protein
MIAALPLSFGQPAWLLLLLLLPLLVWLLRGHGAPTAVRYSSAALLRTSGRTARFGPRGWLWMMRLLALVLLIGSLARPRLERSDSTDHRFGIDAVLVCDVSGSMGTPDYQKGGQQITRMDALIEAIDEFVKARPKDRTGLVGFANDVYLLAPLTTDAGWLPEVLRQIRLMAGTAIGDGMMEGIKLLKASKAKSRVMIVVSDGFNNRGVNPVEAAELARKEGIRVHTIQVMSFAELARSQAGSGLMARIASTTGGLHASASGTEALQRIYQQIDRMEKDRIDAKQTRLYNEIYAWPLAAALALVLFELIAASTFWIRLP